MTNMQASEDGIKPKKSLGQNFLVSQKDLNKIVNAADLKSSDTVVEIGPGTGLLTKLLAERAKSVIAVEKDRHLTNFLDYWRRPHSAPSIRRLEIARQHLH